MKKSLAALLAALVLTPFVLDTLGLGANSAVEVVVFALAAMGLNVLIGQTGLVSFGHGVWFGVAAYIAALIALVMPGHAFVIPLLASIAITVLLAACFGFLMLRRRGVYFALMTLALSAMTFQIAYRWTALTGGENGLGGIERPAWPGFDLNDNWNYYILVAVIAFVVIAGLWRVLHSPAGTVLLAIRENENRAVALGYPVVRYKLFAFMLSAGVTATAGVLMLYKNRMTSADPTSMVFSGELLAMVIIGGMRGFLGPALGAFFYIIFREYLSIYTEHWLIWFGLIFVLFVVFAREGLIGIGSQLKRTWFPAPESSAAMAGRQTQDRPLPDALAKHRNNAGEVLTARALAKSFGSLQAVADVSLTIRDKTLHALIGPNGAGKTTAFNLLTGGLTLSSGNVRLCNTDITEKSESDIAQLGMGRSFQITNLFPDLTVHENIRLAVQARHPSRRYCWHSPDLIVDVLRDADEIIQWVGLAGMERAMAGSLSYGGQRLLDLGLALATHPRILLADEPLAGLSVAERERVGKLIKEVSTIIPVLLVEHDIDRVFDLADHVTVMHEGRVLLDGDVETARQSAAVREVYIGSGTSAVAARARQGAHDDEVLARVETLNVHYGKSHIIYDVDFAIRKREILALLGRNGAGKSTILKAMTGIVTPTSGTISLGGHALAGLPSARIARLGVGYVPQGRGLFAGMSVRDNLELGALRRQTGEGTHWSLDEILDYFPRLKERLDTPADRLSGGEQQMAAVARALSGDTRLLLLDEPFEGLAPAVVEQLFYTFDKLRDHISIIIVDHNLDLALALSDRTLVLEMGKVLHEVASRDLSRDIELRRQLLWL